MKASKIQVSKKNKRFYRLVSIKNKKRIKAKNKTQAALQIQLKKIMLEIINKYHTKSIINCLVK